MLSPFFPLRRDAKYLFFPPSDLNQIQICNQRLKNQIGRSRSLALARLIDLLLKNVEIFLLEFFPSFAKEKRPTIYYYYYYQVYAELSVLKRLAFPPRNLLWKCRLARNGSSIYCTSHCGSR